MGQTGRQVDITALKDLVNELADQPSHRRLESGYPILSKVRADQPGQLVVPGWGLYSIGRPARKQPAAVRVRPRQHLRMFANRAQRPLNPRTEKRPNVTPFVVINWCFVPQALVHRVPIFIMYERVVFDHRRSVPFRSPRPVLVACRRSTPACTPARLSSSSTSRTLSGSVTSMTTRTHSEAPMSRHYLTPCSGTRPRLQIGCALWGGLRAGESWALTGCRTRRSRPGRPERTPGRLHPARMLDWVETSPTRIPLLGRNRPRWSPSLRQ